MEAIVKSNSISNSMEKRMIVRILGYLGNAKKKNRFCVNSYFFMDIRTYESYKLWVKGERELQYGELLTSLINRFERETVSR